MITCGLFFMDLYGKINVERQRSSNSTLANGFHGIYLIYIKKIRRNLLNKNFGFTFIRFLFLFTEIIFSIG